MMTDKTDDVLPADVRETAQATPHHKLMAELLDSRVQKTERDHAAVQEINRLRAERDSLKAELLEHEQRDELGFRAAQRAIDRWRSANPGNDLVRPDKADLLVWLMGQLDALHKRIDEAPVEDGGLLYIRVDAPAALRSKQVALVALEESK